MIGMISSPLAAASVLADSPGTITSRFFGYQGGYYFTDTLQPSIGYWVKTNRAGKLILSSSGGSLNSSRITIVPTDEMPPSPPPGTPSGQRILPKLFAIGQNFPNPFNPTTVLKYDIPTTSRVTLEVYNILGERVGVLVNETKEAGTYTASWNGNGMASGVYIYRLKAVDVANSGNSFSQTGKMLMLK
jgi:hypothetical protein